MDLTSIKDTPPKRLVLRLSSLGDVILATSTLSVWNESHATVDWVVALEFSDVLEGHPGIRKIWKFDRRAGLRAWWALCCDLRAEGYDEIWDLHSTLRTGVARFCFWLGSHKRSVTDYRWQRIGKGRWKLWGLFALKSRWPKRWQPAPFVGRFARFVGGAGTERPSLQHLVGPLPARIADNAAFFLKNGAYCVMPGSKWQGKRWPAEKYLEVIRRTPGVPVVLGGAGDADAFELLDMLRLAKLVHISGVGVWSLREVASVLAASRGYLGNDTGLAHLAEAVGVPALVVFGPTSPEMGFGPWRQESGAIGVPLWCRPCGKDGRRCYRPVRKYLCMTGLDPAEVSRHFAALGSRASDRPGSEPRK